MPAKTKSDLHARVRSVLPPKAQDIYREASREEAALFQRWSGTKDRPDWQVRAYFNMDGDQRRDMDRTLLEKIYEPARPPSSVLSGQADADGQLSAIA